jgi:hypothetical protein
MLEVLKELNQEGIPQVYTIPSPSEPWTPSQIEGMAQFSLALQRAFDWYQSCERDEVIGRFSNR